MIEAAQRYKKAVVIGGGLLGLEAANGLMRARHGRHGRAPDALADGAPARRRGRQAAAEVAGRPRPGVHARRADPGTGRRRRAGACRRCRFKDGTEVAGRPGGDGGGHPPQHRAGRKDEAARATAASSSTTPCRPYDPRIYAVGECAAHRGIAYGLVAPLFEQAKVCANHLAQFGIGRYTGSLTSTKLKVTGIDLFSAGDFMAPGRRRRGRHRRNRAVRSRSAASTRNW